MRRAFSNYRINKGVNRKGVNLLMRSIHKRTTLNSVVVFTAINQANENVQQNWIVEKSKNGKFKYVCFDKRDDDALKTAILNSLSFSEIVVVVVISDMNQKIDKNKSIKEMWGYKIINDGKETIYEEISSEDIYKYSTTNINTGKSIPPTKEIVYCGPDGKICGWDMV